MEDNNQLNYRRLKTMNTKLWAMAFIVVSVLSVMSITTVAAYDADTPYSVTLQWVVPASTTFTVTLAGAESTIDFDDEITAATVSLAEPDSQDNSTSTPVIQIENIGNVALNFTNELNASTPTWATLYVGLTVDPGAATEFNSTTPVEFKADLAASGTQDVYLWTTITSATAGTTQRTYYINASQAP